MASLRFPDNGSRYVFLPNGRPAVNARVYYHSDEALTVPAEIYVDVDGVKGALVAPDSDGRVSLRLDAFGGQRSFWGPVSGQDRLWVVVNGVVSAVDADYNARIDGVETRVTVLEGTVVDSGDVSAAVAAEAALRVSGDAASVSTAAADATTKADAAQSAAISTAASDATAKVTAHTNATDPHGDRTAAATDATSKANAALSAAQASSLQKTANLGDLGSSSTARTNLGLGSAATAAVGTGAGTVAAGDDSRITGAAQKSANLSDLASPTTARTSLGLGSAATRSVGTTSADVAAGDTPAAAQAAAISTAATDATTKANAAQAAATAASAQRSANLSDLGSASTARTNLGLGAAATRAVGTTSGDVAAGDAPAAAQAAATSAAATDATTKANAAQAAAISAATSNSKSADTITDGTTNKAYTATEKTKLAGVATGATANSTDAQLRDRALHTGVQAISTVSGLQTSLDAKVIKGDLFIDPRDAPYNADATGATDATAGVLAAFADANAKMRTGLSASIRHPGATVVLQGTYNLASLSTPIEMNCNVVNHGAVFIVPAAYAGVAVLVGHSGDGVILQAADISLPDIVKPTGTAIVAGSVAVRAQNLFNSQLAMARTLYFETGLHGTGWNNGTSYCDIFIGWMSYCKVPILLKPHLTGGYANQCTFVGGGIQQSVGYAGGTKVAGWRHMVLDGNNISNVTGNTFINVSFEGDVSEYVFELRGAYDNSWYSCRHEQGVNPIAVTVSGATLTRVAHGLTVGTMIVFSASVTPTGMFLVVPYYVTSVPTADTFTVSTRRGGTDIVFGSSGTNVGYNVPQRILIDATSQLTSNNTWNTPMTPVRALDMIVTGTQHLQNNIHWSDRHVMDGNTESDTPTWRGRNRSGTAATRAIFAAYPPANNPVDDPFAWTVAISDRGLLFAESRAEIGRIYGAGGIIQYRRPSDSVPYEIPSARRSPGLITSIAGLSVPANTTTTATFTLTGASVNDHVVVTPVSGMLTGVVLSHAYVSSADTVTVSFGNLTVAPIVISPTLQAVAFRRFF